MKNYLFVLITICFYSSVCLAQINPAQMVSVEFKSGMEDQGIPYFEDMLFGISATEVIQQLNEMKVNTIRIPIAKALTTENKPEVIIDFVSSLYNNGGAHFKILLNERKWDLEKTTNQEDWANHIAFAYNALQEVGLSHMVAGCVFDENRRLEGAQSDQALWDKRHNGVLSALDFLNAKTNNAFKTRTVFIHGKGYGSQFKGVKASSDGLGFPEKMETRCASYAYNFKHFETSTPEDKSLQGWKNHYNNYCHLKEVHEMGAELVFVGDAGDGLRGYAFEPGRNPYGGPGQYVMRALRDVFVDYGWQGMSFGTFIKGGHPDDLGRTILFAAYNSELVPRELQVESWEIWYNTTRSTYNAVDMSNTETWKVYPNPCSELLKIKFPQPTRLSIRNIYGEIILDKNMQGEVSVDVSSLKTGFYIVQIQGKDGILTKKVFKN